MSVASGNIFVPVTVKFFRNLYQPEHSSNDMFVFNLTIAFTSQHVRWNHDVILQQPRSQNIQERNLLFSIITLKLQPLALVVHHWTIPIRPSCTYASQGQNRCSLHRRRSRCRRPPIHLNNNSKQFFGAPECVLGMPYHQTPPLIQISWT